MSWTLFVLVVVLGIALLFVPGFLLLWLLGVRDVKAALLAPAVGVGVLGVLTFIATPIGHWSWAYPLIATIGLAIAVAIQSVRAKRRHLSAKSTDSPTETPSKEQVPWFPTALFALAGVAVFCAVYAPILAQYWQSPDAVQSYGDAAFHYQGTLLVSLSGDVSPLTAMSAIYAPVSPSPVYYPSLWAAIGSLLSFGSVAAGMNALTLAVGLVAWPLTLSALAIVLVSKPSKPSHASVAFWAPFMASFLSIYPGRTMFRNAMDPFALSVLTLPAALALIICAHRDRHNRQYFWKWPVLLGIVFLGAVASQPGTAVAIGFALAAWLLICLFRTVRGSHRTPSAYVGATATTLGAIGVLVAIAWALTQTSYIQRLAGFQRSVVGIKAGINHFLTGSASILAPDSAAHLPWTFVAIAALLGAVLLVKRFSGQVVSLTSAILLVFYLAACYDETWIRDLTGVWYKDYDRLAIFVWSLILPFAAIGLSTCISWLSRFFRPQRALAVLVLSLGTAGLFAWNALLPEANPDSLGAQVRNGYSLDEGADALLTADSQQIIESIGDTFAPGDYVASAPVSGGQFVASQGSALSFYPLSQPRTPAQKTVSSELDEINENPEVCEAINAGNVRGLITNDGPLTPEQREEMQAFKGILDVDTSEGFELVSESGPLRLWRITACN